MENTPHTKPEDVSKWDWYNADNPTDFKGLTAEKFKGKLEYLADIEVCMDRLDLEGKDLRNFYCYRARIQHGDFRKADMRGANFSYADLRHSKFEGVKLYGADLKKANLSGSDLRGVDFGDADLYSAKLKNADLRGADLSKCRLRKVDFHQADLRGAKLPDDIPEVKDIHRKLYHACSKDGNKLDMGYWHGGPGGGCGTSHCRAGWLVHMIGEEGYRYEEKLSVWTAAALIYAKSDPELEKVPDFYASTPHAKTEMRKRAEEEQHKEDMATVDQLSKNILEPPKPQERIVFPETVEIEQPQMA